MERKEKKKERKRKLKEGSRKETEREEERWGVSWGEEILTKDTGGLSQGERTHNVGFTYSDILFTIITINLMPLNVIAICDFSSFPFGHQIAPNPWHAGFFFFFLA